MSLVVLYGDELVADRRCVLQFPHALGQIKTTKKIRVSKDKTFAFGSVGPTLSEKELDVLEEILRTCLKKAKGNVDLIPLGHSDWFKVRGTLSIFVMTKMANYYSYIVFPDLRKPEGYPSHLRSLEESHLVRFESDMPAGSGTGFFQSSVALQEGVAMQDLMPIVASICATVSADFDLVHRKSLKRMSYE